MFWANFIRPGKKKAVTEENEPVINNERKTLRATMSAYSDNEIYNFDESYKSLNENITICCFISKSGKIVSPTFVKHGLTIPCLYTDPPADQNSEFTKWSRNGYDVYETKSKGMTDVIVDHIFQNKIGRSLVIIEKATWHQSVSPKNKSFEHIKVELIKEGLTEYLQPLDMGFFSTVRNRNRSYRRNFIYYNDHTPSVIEKLSAAAKILHDMTPAVKFCWHLSGLTEEGRDMGRCYPLKRD